MSRHQARRTRSLKTRRFARGVGLVEVMIALVILAIGFLALGQLQSASVRSAAESRTRTAAVNLAVDKLDELRSFYARVSDADGNGTADLVIDTNGDGRPDVAADSFDQIAAGTDTPGEVAAGGTGFNFTRNWQVTPCTLSQAGVVACGGTLTMGAADFARVSVRVQWNAADGATATQEVVLEDLISSTTPMDAAVALSNPATSRESPKVYIQPARIQSTIPIAIGDDAASAASDPQPAIIRDNIVRTQFEVLTFSGSGNDLLAERAFDYTVIGCDCRIDAGTNGVVAGKKSWEPTVWNGLTFTRPRELTNGQPHPVDTTLGTVNRVTATAILRNNDPDLVKDLCTSCCRDHHDTSNSSTPKLNPSRPASEYLANGNHKHYRPVLSGGNYTFVDANASGDQYYETCRFLRRDGIYRLTLDATLVDLQVFPEALLDEPDERLAYSEYAAKYIDTYVTAAANPANGYPFMSDTVLAQVRSTALAAIPAAHQAILARLDPTTPYDLSAPGLQSTSRGIYVDYMTPEVLTAIRCKINNTPNLEECLPYQSSTKLELVPFFAVGMTRLNNWSPTFPEVATMPLRNSNDPFSRGWSVPVRDGETPITARSPISNVGLTNPVPGSPLEVGAVISDSIRLEVGGTAAPIDPPRTVRFVVTNGQGTFLDTSEVVVLSGLGGNQCRLAGSQNNGGATWICTLSTAGVGQVIFTSYTGSECVERDRGNTCIDQEARRNVLCFSPSPAVVTPYLDPSNAYLDNTTVGFNGSQANAASYTVDVKPGTFTCPNSDAAPGVVSTDPANGASLVPLSTPSLTVDFSESVNVAAGGVTLTCSNAGGTTGNLVAGGSSLAATEVQSMTVALEPILLSLGTFYLPAASTCTLTVLASAVTDVDLTDPPDQMASNYVAQFTTNALSGDDAPRVTTTTPSNGAPSVPSDTSLEVNFSEAVNAAAGAVTLSCDGNSIALSNTSGSNVTQLRPTYSGALTSGATCTMTVIASLVTDVDTNDPPDQMALDHPVQFTVAAADVAPSVSTATYTPRTTGPGSQNARVTINFSELVNINTTAFTWTCTANNGNVNTVAFTTTPALPATGISTITLTAGGNLPNNPSCRVTVLANRVNDTDTMDPPDFMVTNYTFDFAP